MAGRLQFRWYNKLSFEDILKDAAALPPHSAIYWLMMNVDAAGVAHESGSALSRLSAVANAPIFAHDGTYFGEGIVGGPMHSVPELSKKTAEVAIRILNGEKAGDIKPSFVPLASPDIRLASNAALGDQREQSAAGQHNCLPGAHRVGAVFVANRTRIIAVILMQAGLIAILLREHRRRQLAEVQSRQRMAELAHVNRFSTAGELTASIAHEINQPLGVYSDQRRNRTGNSEISDPDIAEPPTSLNSRIL